MLREKKRKIKIPNGLAGASLENTRLQLARGRKYFEAGVQQCVTRTLLSRVTGRGPGVWMVLVSDAVLARSGVAARQRHSGTRDPPKARF